jgi:hypothetical protein
MRAGYIAGPSLYRLPERELFFTERIHWLDSKPLF